MHKLLIDVNVPLDVILARDPHAAASENILVYLENKKAKGYLSAASFPILYYLIRKSFGHQKTMEHMKTLLKFLHVVEINKSILEISLYVKISDFEDGIQVACAQHCGADFIITRDLESYKHSSFPFMTPAKYLATYSSE